MQKRPFILVEILIAFFLLSLCLIPLVKGPVKLYKEALENLRMMELERMADWTFTEIKELFLKNEIPWEQIPAKKGHSDRFPLSVAFLEIPGYPRKKVERSFTLQTKGERGKEEGPLYRELEVQVSLNNIEYKFILIVERVFVD